METTRLSSKGQVIIPKALRVSHRWNTGLELMVIDMDDGILLKPKAPFAPTEPADVAGMLRDKVRPMTDKEITAALEEDLRERWRDGR